MRCRVSATDIYSPRSGAAGFSLPEIMVVLVVMSILLGVGVPNFLSIGRRDAVETTALDLQRTLALARQKALAQRIPYRLTVDPAAKSYVIERRQGNVWVVDGLGSQSWSERVNLTMSAGGAQGNLDVVIEPRGTLDAGDAPALFTFTNAHGDTTRVSFVRTGRLRVHS